MCLHRFRLMKLVPFVFHSEIKCNFMVIVGNYV